jgi:hypothetical protein
MRATAYAGLAMTATAGLGDEWLVKDWVAEAERLSGGDRSNPLLLMVGGLADFLSTQDGALAANMRSLLDADDPWVRALARLNYARQLPFADRREPVELALAEFRETGERWGTSFALTTMGDLEARQGDLAAALRHYEEAITAASAVGTVEDVVFMRGREAQLHWLLGDHEGSAAALARAERDAAGLAWADSVAGLALYESDLARWAGDLTTARAQLARCETLLQGISAHPFFLSMVATSRGHLAAAAGDLDAAAGERVSALELAAVADEDVIGRVLVGVADHALRRDRPADAVRLLAAVEVLGGGLDRSSPEAVHADEAARAALGDGAASELRAGTKRELTGLDWAAASAWMRELAAAVLGQPVSAPAGGGTASSPTGS